MQPPGPACFLSGCPACEFICWVLGCLRMQVEGTPERPRLAVFRSNNHIYAQVRWACRASTCHRCADMQPRCGATVQAKGQGSRAGGGAPPPGHGGGGSQWQGDPTSRLGRVGPSSSMGLHWRGPPFSYWLPDAIDSTAGGAGKWPGSKPTACRMLGTLAAWLLSPFGAGCGSKCSRAASLFRHPHPLHLPARSTS